MTGSGVIRRIGGAAADYADANPPYVLRASEDLLLLKFRDGPAPAGFTDGKADLVAGMQILQRQAFVLEFA